MQILAVIPARGGSKGIPNKNVYPINGKPLICYTIESISQCNVIFDVVVSTDSDDIARIANEYDVRVVKRPDDISSDTAKTESALLHAIYEMEMIGMEYEHVMTLQVTSPLRKAETIDSFIINYYDKEKEGFDAQVSLTADYCDLWIANNGSFARLFPDAPRRRQDRQPVYIENSAVYITSISALKQTSSVLGTKCAGYIIPHNEAIDINTYDDLKYVEYLLSRV